MFQSKTRNEQEQAVQLIQMNSHIVDAMHDLHPLIEEAGKARIVMLGEASHGTHEYYTWRSYISRKLITEKGFNFIAVEGDWPDCYKINEYIKGESEEKRAVNVLKTMARWPTWMWANWEVEALAEWLRKHNKDLRENEKVGFFGLDVYSLWDSLSAIMQYLQEKDPKALEQAKKAIQCFEPYKRDDGTSYAYATQMVP